MAKLIELTEQLKGLSAQLRKRAEDSKADADKKGKDKVAGEDYAELKKRFDDLTGVVDELKKNKPRKSEFDEGGDDDKGKNLSMSLLLKSKSEKDEVRLFQDQCDAIMILSALKKCHPSQLRGFETMKKNLTELAKAMNTATANQGSDWVPTDFSAQLYRQVELEAKVAALFDDIPMPTDTYKLPIDTAGLTMYIQAEAQSDSPSKIPASTAATANATLNATKLALRTLLSTEITEDSIIDILPFIRERIARAVAAGWDNVLLNGDTAGTHMDSDVTDATDIRKSFLGIRAHAVDGSAGAAIAGSNLAESDLRLARKAMGKYGVDPAKLAVITGPTGYLEMLTRFTNFQTADKYGNNATIFNGELGKFDGIPIIVSDQYRENLNATGVYDGTTTTKTSVSLVHRPALVAGTRRVMTVKTDEDIEVDMMIFVMTIRKALINLYASTQKFAYHVYNVA